MKRIELGNGYFAEDIGGYRIGHENGGCHMADLAGAAMIRTIERMQPVYEAAMAANGTGNMKLWKTLYDACKAARS